MFFLPEWHTFHHIDTLDPMNGEAAHEIASKVVEAIVDDGSKIDLVTHHGLRQVNVYDCGVHVLVQADNAIRQVVDKNVSSDQFSPENRPDVRGERRSVLNTLSVLAWARDNPEHVI